MQGLAVTMHVSLLGLAGATILAFGTAFLRLSNSFVGGILARIYLESIRNTPLLVQIFVIYFVLAPIAGFDRLTAAVLALALFEGAYASEIIRAGILSVPHGQWEAAISLGMPTSQIYRQIILPQSLKTMLPPLVSQSISLIKDSALVSTIAIYDLSMHAQAIVSETFLTFEVWFTVAAIYLLLTSTLSFLANVLAKCQTNPNP